MAVMLRASSDPICSAGGECCYVIPASCNDNAGPFEGFDLWWIDVGKAGALQHFVQGLDLVNKRSAASDSES